jgi:hypothetical protein
MSKELILSFELVFQKANSTLCLAQSALCDRSMDVDEMSSVLLAMSVCRYQHWDPISDRQSVDGMADCDGGKFDF